jgi:hypothetical protein
MRWFVIINWHVALAITACILAGKLLAWLIRTTWRVTWWLVCVPAGATIGALRWAQARRQDFSDDQPNQGGREMKRAVAIVLAGAAVAACSPSAHDEAHASPQ